VPINLQTTYRLLHVHRERRRCIQETTMHIREVDNLALLILHHKHMNVRLLSKPPVKLLLYCESPPSGVILQKFIQAQ
jgi:hypothetical protein